MNNFILSIPVGIAVGLILFYNNSAMNTLYDRSMIYSLRWMNPLWRLMKKDRMKDGKVKNKNEDEEISQQQQQYREGVVRKTDDVKYVIGIDIGASGIGVGIFMVDSLNKIIITNDSKGNKQERRELDISIEQADRDDQNHMIEKLKSLIYHSLLIINDGNESDKNKRIFVGIGIPGLIDSHNGIVKKASNFNNWPADFHLLSPLQSLYPQITFTLENDANCALLGEIWQGSLANTNDVRHAVMMSLGSGIGGAVFSNGKILHGSSGMLGEIGHMIVHAHGRYHEATKVHGVLEAYASAFAILDQAKKRISPTISNAKEVFDLAYNQSNKIASDIITEAANYIGIGLINVCRFYDPQVIILSGGLILAGDKFVDEIKLSFQNNHWSIQKPQCTIIVSTLGDEAGMYGAAYNAILHS